MDTQKPVPSFENLAPGIIFDAVEHHLGVFLDGSITPYNSYINRVFGLADEDGNQYIVKFYRPGRWTREAIQDEHRFLSDCADAEIPVIPPLRSAGGETLGTEEDFLFAVFPRVRARTFDINTEEDWLRTGRAIGRMHRVAQKRAAPSRLRCTPQDTTARYIKTLEDNRLVHPDCADDFYGACSTALSLISPLFAALPGRNLHRIHGDCHRGNILEHPETGIILIDFDDMMTGPAIQDLWLLLPGHLGDSMKEMNLILEGYEQFCEFDRETLALVEPLRFMRHIYFLSWCATQREDPGFAQRFPDWGTRAFWIQETEDLSTQLAYIAKS